MNRHNHKWSWLLALGLLLAFFLVKAPVEGGGSGGSNTLNITGVTSPTQYNMFAYVNGTATSSGAPPTFQAWFVNSDGVEFDAPIVSTTWNLSAWELKLYPGNLPPQFAHYRVKVKATFSGGQALYDISGDYPVPTCQNQVCYPPG
jgi:hypothetical protein